MALTLTDLQTLIDGRIIENSTQEISASDLNELLHEILEYANEHDIADSRISAAIARTAAMNNAILIAKNDVKTELRGGVPAAGDTLKKLHDLILILSSSTPPAPVPIGLICMWSGDGTTLPANWALSNGSNGTPALRGRFIVGYHPTVADYNEPGNLSVLKFTASAAAQIPGETGGSATHILAKANIPTHHHLAKGDGGTISVQSGGSHNHGSDTARLSSKQVGINSGGGESANDIYGGSIYTSSSHSHSNNDFAGQVGNGATDGLLASPTSINHRPPYYTLAYIMKIS
jgi:hypothetical protein